MVDKTCRACSTTKSSQWTRSKMIPGADLCTQCYRKETKIREGKIDMEQLKKEAGILELRKKSDDAEEAESGASDATAAGGIGGKRTHLPHEVAPPPPKKVKKSYYQKETGYHPGHLSRRCGEVVARSGHTKNRGRVGGGKEVSRVVVKVLRLQLGGFRQQVERERLALGR